MGKLEGKTKLGRHWRRWEDPTKTRLECGGGGGRKLDRVK
jgi:hypothetical protein